MLENILIGSLVIAPRIQSKIISSAEGPIISVFAIFKKRLSFDLAKINRSFVLYPSLMQITFNDFF
jgi:hypothetical protein|tara:strand:- start:205 stop:402 length:198 start_codon:yes stop_codon:yes gene_type:complete